jgi:CRISPR/Cas system Type II protein with McrA/HNH and RuvC-like nuclease domain
LPCLSQSRLPHVAKRHIVRGKHRLATARRVVGAAFSLRAEWYARCTARVSVRNDAR